MIVRWIGAGFVFGERRRFVSFDAFDVELNFTIAFSSVDSSVEIQEMKLSKTINHETDIEQEVTEVHKIITDKEFNKKFNRHYELLKFVTEDFVVSVGSYWDDLKRNSKPYLVCGDEFINLLADSDIIENEDDLRGTIFEPMMCLFSKKELAKTLLQH